MIVGSLVLALGLSFTGIAQDVVHDSARSRDIPIQVSLPVSAKKCTVKRKCPVAFITPGGGLGPNDYQFLVRTFNRLGYLTVSTQSVLPNDPPEGTSGNIVTDRSPGWQRGVDDLHVLQRTLSRKYPRYEWQKSLTLVGHSNGGDYSAMALQQKPGFARTLITLDNRRFPLPRSSSIRVLSIRGSDFPADPGVLPDQWINGDRCIVTIKDAKHNDMNDRGPDWQKAKVQRVITSFVSGNRCERQP